MQKILLTLITLFNIFLIYGQKSRLDSLLMRIENESERMKIETYLDISELPISQDSSLYYLDKALVTAKKIKFDSIYPIQFVKTVSHYIIGDFQQAKKEIRKGLRNYTYTLDPKATKGHINMLLGVFSEALNQIDSSKYYYAKTLKILEGYKTEKAQEIIGVTYTNYGNLFLKSGDYEEAIKIYFKSDKLSETIGDNKNRIITLNNIAGAFKELKDFDKSLRYYNNALELAISSNDIQNVGTTNIGVGEIYLLKNNNELALKYFLKASKILEEIDFKSPLSAVYQNIAELYLNSDKHNQADIYIKKAINQIANIEDAYTKTSILITQAHILSKKSNIQEALKILDKAVIIAKTNGYMNLEKDALIKRAELSKSLNRFFELSNDYERLIHVKDSIFSIDKIEALSNIEAKYQSEKKEKENLQLKADNAEQELLTQKANTRNWLLAFGILAVVISAFFIWRKYKSEAKAKTLINEQKNLVETLQKELHHRMKNNLSFIDLFINLAKGRFQDEAYHTKLNELQNRMRSMFEVHKQLFKTDDVTSVKAKNYIDTLVKNVQDAYANHHITISNQTDAYDTILADTSFPVGLIINEFVTNSYKYAFGDKEQGNIDIKLTSQTQSYTLSLKDNGKGFPKDFDMNNLDSFGLETIQLLTKEYGGTFDVDGSDGVAMTITLPKTAA